jgi:hypothetical protein
MVFSSVPSRVVGRIRARPERTYKDVADNLPRLAQVLNQRATRT